MEDKQTRIELLRADRENLREKEKANYDKLDGIIENNGDEKERYRLIGLNNRIHEQFWEIAAELAKLEENVVYIRWDAHADSWTGQRSMLSVHKTLEGAIAAMPESIRKKEYKRDLFANYVANYTYEVVERVELGE